ncbi:hypothetical protein BAE44_0006215 [Dichanthelium oligosanthes]|uniref:F-box domain-containing protein n=1 Tax=Dichanthelium oligosanthes TaxID=888268 RepID=A0A1E5W5W9_9POAL|nr:hypothetical protein BAE44_0006215 [Dichanthelium oligosanthes]
MDSTAEDARDAKRARLTPSAGDVNTDRISGLDDDVLLRVLGLADDARYAARTAALSRRWLRLWPRVPALRFASRLESKDARGAERRAALDQYVSYVNGVLAPRSAQSGCAIETLSISYTSGPAHNEEELMQASVDAAQGWIRYAFQHGVKSFILDLPSNVFERTVVLDELPSIVRLETMRLPLGGKILRLPTTMKFASVMDLSLEEIQIAEGDVHLLACLVSPVSCPRLQKLRMIKFFS